MFPSSWEYHIAPQVNAAVRWLLSEYGEGFDAFSDGLLKLLLSIQGTLQLVPWWGYIVVIAALTWVATKKVVPVVILSLMPVLIGVFGLWGLAIETLAIVITSVVLAGILMAEVKVFDLIVRPVLDAMQTMPSFVYLIPAMMLFGLGKVPAILATLIYALPPVIRLTSLGIQLVPKPAQEAARAYGATRWQLLTEVRIPLAMPSILAGVNQTTMMALAMVVIASMIGARGLGQEVLLAINRIDVGRGFEAGLGIVIMAIVIDRITQGMAKKWDPQKRA